MPVLSYNSGTNAKCIAAVWPTIESGGLCPKQSSNAGRKVCMSTRSFLTRTRGGASKPNFSVRSIAARYSPTYGDSFRPGAKSRMLWDGFGVRDLKNDKIPIQFSPTKGRQEDLKPLRRSLARNCHKKVKLQP